MRGSWRPNKTAIYWPPLLWPSALCLSRSPDVQPEAWGLCSLLDEGFLYCILSPTGLQNSVGGSEGPFGRMWLSLSHLVSDVSDLQLSDFLSTKLSNSSTPTQSPTQPLEWHVWSSSSGNNCHAVHRSLSSVASVYECTMGILPCPILLAQSTYAISPHKCHRNVSLPSGASLWNGIFGWVEGQYITTSVIVGYLIIPQWIDGTLTATTTWSQSGLGSNGNEGVLHIPPKLQVWWLTIRYCLAS